MARRKKKKKKAANLVGPIIQGVRYRLGLTQEELAAQCQLAGLDISRGTLSQIEAQLRRVIDSELFQLSVVLGVTTDSLYPEELLRRRKGRRRGVSSRATRGQRKLK